MMTLIALLVALIGICAAGMVTLKKLEEKNIIPVRNHPFTGKKNNAMMFDVIRVYLFGVLAIAFFLTGNTSVMYGFVFIVGFQIIWIISQIKLNMQQKNTATIYFDENEQLEWKRHFDEKTEYVKNGKVDTVEKIVLVDDVLYFKKNEKILLREKIYHYIFASQITLEKNMLTISYGFMGIPMFNRHVYIPKSKKDEMELLVIEMRKNPNINKKIKSKF